MDLVCIKSMLANFVIWVLLEKMIYKLNLKLILKWLKIQ